MRNPVEGKNIVIIGSGVGGLSTGILLSLLNFQVTVVEKNPLPGGLMRSYRRSGIDCPVGVHYVGALGENELLGKMQAILGTKIAPQFQAPKPGEVSKIAISSRLAKEKLGWQPEIFLEAGLSLTLDYVKAQKLKV